MKNYSDEPRTKIRRSDRAVTDDVWIKDFLEKTPFGSLALIHNNQPFTNMNIFAYSRERHAIYMHTARTGRTRSISEENKGPCCFSVCEMGRLLPAEVALEFSVEYQGVVVFGKVSVVADQAEARVALQLMLDKYFPHLESGTDYRPITPKELERTTVYCIEIEEWSGKQKIVEDDFPGAFEFKDIPVHEEI